MEAGPAPTWLLRETFTSVTWKDLVKKIRDAFIEKGPVKEHVRSPAVRDKVVRRLLCWMNEFFMAGHYEQVLDILRVLSPIYHLVGSELWPIFVRLLRLVGPEEAPSIIRLLQDLAAMGTMRRYKISIYTELVVYLVGQDKLIEAYELAASTIAQATSISRVGAIAAEAWTHASTIRGLYGLLGWFFVQDRKADNPLFPGALSNIATSVLLERIRSSWNFYFYLNSVGKTDELYPIICLYAQGVLDIIDRANMS